MVVLVVFSVAVVVAVVAVEDEDVVMVDMMILRVEIF